MSINTLSCQKRMLWKMSKECCGNCSYGYCDKELLDYICTNSESKFVADFTDYKFWCEAYEPKRKGKA